MKSHWVVTEVDYKMPGSGIKVKIGITERQLTLVQLMAKGYHFNEIAKMLALSERWVENLAYKIRQNFACRTNAQLVAVFFVYGIIEIIGWKQ